MKHYAFGSMVGCQIASIIAGLAGHLERAVGWMAVCGLFCVAYALLDGRPNRIS